jgi:hypothetical protein
MSNAPKYIPNHIELDKRAVYLTVSALIITYAVASLLQDDFYVWIPGRRGRSISEHLHGSAAWLAALSVFSAAANMISVVIDHYDQRNNETNYRAFARWSFRGAVALLVLALFVHGASKPPRTTVTPNSSNEPTATSTLLMLVAVG